MGLIVDRAQAGDGDVGVELRGGQGGVAKQLLNDAEVCASFEEMRCRTVPKPVWADVGGAVHCRHGLVHDSAGLAWVETPSSTAEKESGT